MTRRIEVFHKVYNTQVELDIGRIIAVVPLKRLILFENVSWELEDEDFFRVLNLWREWVDG